MNDPHRFRVGQNVQFIGKVGSKIFGATPAGEFKVVRLLPATQGRNQYRVESLTDNQNRVAVETDLASRSEVEDTDMRIR